MTPRPPGSAAQAELARPTGPRGGWCSGTAFNGTPRRVPLVTSPGPLMARRKLPTEADFRGFASPTATVGGAAVNGTATAVRRNDGAPARGLLPRERRRSRRTCVKALR